MHPPRRLPHLLLLTLAACQGEPQPPAVTGGATATGSVIVSAEPILAIAPTDSDGVPLLAYTVDATRLSTGTIALVDQSIDAVLLFNATGEPIGRVGRTGAGPGEFTGIGGIGRCAGDTLLVWDRMNDRMSVLAPTGEFLRAYRPPGQPVTGYCAGSSDYVVWTALGYIGNPAPDAPPIRGTAAIVSAEGDSVGTLGEVQAGESRPLGKMTVFAVTPTVIYVGTGDSAAVALHPRDGSAVHSFGVGSARRPVTDAEYEAAIASMVGTVPGTAEERATVLGFIRQRFPKPEYLPPYRALFTNGVGDVFVVTSPLGSGTTEIEMFDSKGSPAGQLRIPGDIEVYEIGLDYLLGMAEDENGEQRVVMYHIEVGTR